MELNENLCKKFDDKYRKYVHVRCVYNCLYQNHYIIRHEDCKIKKLFKRHFALTKGDLFDGAKENPVDAAVAGDVVDVDAGGFEGEPKENPLPAAIGAGGDV